MKNENRYRVVKNGYGYYVSEVKYVWFPIWIPFNTSWCNSEEEAWERVRDSVGSTKSEGKKESEL